MGGASVVDPIQAESEHAAGEEEGFSVPAENPCLTRLRHRRLLAFLLGQRYDGAFNALLHQAREQFSLEYLQQLVTKGLWEDAAGYVESFLPAGPRSLDAQVLYNFLLMHHYIASFVAGDKAARGLILDNDWMRYVTYAHKTDDRMPPPVMARSVLFLEDVSFCRRRAVKKQVPRVKSVDVARLIKGSRRHIRRLERSSLGSFHEAKKWLSSCIDTSLQGGVPLGCYALQPSGKEGSTILPVWKLANRAGSSGMTGVTNAV